MAFLILFLSFSFAKPAHAGVLSFISDLFSSASAAEEVVASIDVNSQTASLLKATPALLASAPSETDVTIVGGSAILPDSGPLGTIADVEDIFPSNGQIDTYTVRKGDNISKVATMFGVSVNTIMWANGLGTKTLTEGQSLVILPVSGVKHTVKSGDTIQKIAKLYGGDVEEILGFNNIDSTSKLIVGDIVIVPDGEVKVSSSSNNNAKKKFQSLPSYEDYYIRPIANFRKTQGIHGYNGVDLAPTCKCSGVEPILASAPGKVIIARTWGWNGGYGQYVVIAHSNGTQTLYSHAAKVLVNEGDSVIRGQIIGYVGNTGKSTGPHLHFEIRGAKNPF